MMKTSDFKLCWSEVKKLLIFSILVFISCFACFKICLNLFYEINKELPSGGEIEIFEKEESTEQIAKQKDLISVLVFESGNQGEPEKISLGEFRLTAYCSCEKCCGKWALNRPKDENGKDIVYGSTGEILIAGQSIAVDPDVIPYGSEIEINGTRYIAHDCGGAIKGNRIDVYFDNHQDALDFGVQYREVFLIVG